MMLMEMVKSEEWTFKPQIPLQEEFAWDDDGSYSCIILDCPAEQDTKQWGRVYLHSFWVGEQYAYHARWNTMAHGHVFLHYWTLWSLKLEVLVCGHILTNKAVKVCGVKGTGKRKPAFTEYRLCVRASLRVSYQLTLASALKNVQEGDCRNSNWEVRAWWMWEKLPWV